MSNDHNRVTHTPVLVDEIIDLFQPKPGDRLLDATLGTGGHARAYLEATQPTGTVVGLDADPHALEQAHHNLEHYTGRVTFINENFAYLNDSIQGGGMVQNPPTLEQHKIEGMFNHILFDLGMGSHQLADPHRGFSFQEHTPLVMRYGTTSHLPPASLVALNRLTQRLGKEPEVLEILGKLASEEIAEVLKVYGEERYARRIANAIKKVQHPALTAKELADCIEQTVPKTYEHRRIHPATRTFQALRLAVNRELEALAVALPQAVEQAQVGGIVAVISFHSLEDRIVKRFAREKAREGKVEILTKRPLRASDQEKMANPRSRSAKLRAMKKT